MGMSGLAGLLRAKPHCVEKKHVQANSGAGVVRSIHASWELRCMNAVGSEKKEFRRVSLLADAISDRKDRSGDSELPPDNLEAEKKKQPAWIFHGRGARMESISISLWAWLVVGVLSAWFVIWLAETLGRLGTRIP